MAPNGCGGCSCSCSSSGCNNKANDEITTLKALLAAAATRDLEVKPLQVVNEAVEPPAICPESYNPPKCCGIR